MATDNSSMTKSIGRRRIARAQELGAQHPGAAEILRFYVAIASFQDNLQSELGKPNAGTSAAEVFARPLAPNAADRFGQFLAVVERAGPPQLREAAIALRQSHADVSLHLLNAFWNSPASGVLPSGPQDFFARAFLQPYAERIRAQSILSPIRPAPLVCPLCRRKPGFAVLRPLGEGGQRSLVCSFCLAEWEFRRIVCPACGEENHAKLPVYTAAEFQNVRVEACESCRIYIKTVDLTKSGRAEPVVDEIAAIPLDLWAQNQGYAKLQLNLMQF